MDAMNSTHENRRQAIRITDRVLFSYSPVSAETLARVQEDYSRGIALDKQEALADIQMYIGAQSALARVRERDPDLGDFLQHLDTKVSQILNTVQGGKSPFDELAMHEVNLSGKGLAFSAPQAIAVGDNLEFHIVLLPDYIFVYCFGQVVNCEKDTDQDGEKSYRVSAKFTMIMQEDEESLIQHNFKQQRVALRNRRLSAE